jgi:hypothetical protein
MRATKIAKVNKVEFVENGDWLYRIVLDLDCGHSIKVNPIYTYRAGDRWSCYQCDNQNFGKAFSAT